jgi:hypothetical protein
MLAVAAACLVVGTACSPGTSPGIAGTWCVDDSLTVYDTDQPYFKYGFTARGIGSAYCLTFAGRTVTPSPDRYNLELTTWFEGDTTTLVDFLTLPSRPGTYTMRGDSLMFDFGTDGPSWFWKVARHDAPHPNWESRFTERLDTATAQPGTHRLRLAWRPR